MKKQLLSLVYTGVFGLAFMPTPSYLENTNLQNNSLEATINSSDDKWISSIKESASTNFPKLIFTRHAALPYEQSMLVAEYMLLSKTNREKNDDILFFYNNSMYTQGVWSAKEWETKYSKINSSTKDWNFKLVNNLSKIDNSLGKFNYEQYLDKNITNGILSYYTKKKSTPNIKFDIWIVDAGLEYLFSNNKDLYNFIKHVNKIYVMTDGNYQPYFFVRNAINRYEERGYSQLTQQQIEEKFKNYRQDTSNSLKKDFEKHKLYDFINDQNLFTFFHINSYTDSDYYKKTYNLKNIELYKTYKVNYNYYDLATKLFSGNTKTSEDNKKTFIEDYEKFFKVYNFNNLSDFLWKNTDKYDPKKKNVIWLGDSLIKMKAHAYPERLKEERNIVQSWLRMFPTNEYNFFVKNHPIYVEDSETKWSTNIPNAITGQVQLTNLLVNNEEQASNIIYFRNVPWEVFLSWEYNKQKNNSNYVSLFNLDPTKNNTIFVGLQYTTTSIQTTASFLEERYGYSLDDVSKLLNSYYFPITETYDVVNRTSKLTFSNKDYLEGKYAKRNKQKIEEIYDPFVELKIFPEYKTNQLLSSDFIKKSYDPNYSVHDPNDSNQTRNVVIISVSVTCSIIALVVMTIVIIFVIHKKKKK